jgi:signal transduction histidine kinase
VDLWRLLLDPIASVTSDGERRRARIIAGLCVPVFLFAVVEIFESGAPVVFIGVAILAAASFALGKTAWTRAAGVALFGALLALPYFGLATAEATTSATLEVMLPVLAVLVAGLCLPFRWYVTLAGLNAAVLLWLLAANPGIPPAQGFEFWGLVLLVSFVTGIHALVQMRNEQELERAEELAALHEQLLAAQEQLVQAAKLAAVGELAAGVAHELNNPLTATLGYASLLEAKLEDSEFSRARLHGWVDQLSESTRRCQDICQRLLSFARMSGGEHEAVDVGEVVRSTASLLRHQLDRHGAELCTELDGDLLVQGSRGQLEQVVTNLLMNACQALDGAGSITVRGQCLDDEVRLQVIDDGPGMDPDVRDRIFEPFFTTKPEGSGTGLGLSVSAGIVREHGGRIEVASEPDQGATFTVSLPCSAP